MTWTQVIDPFNNLVNVACCGIGVVIRTISGGEADQITVAFDDKLGIV